MGKNNLSLHWKEIFNARKSRNEFLITITVLILFLFLLTRFLIYIEDRNGIVLNDPLLNLFTPVNLTWLIFILIYVSLFTGLISLFWHPGKFILAIQIYILMIAIRIGAMYFVPLDPPSGMIPLADPFVEIFGTGKLLTKDLFFSGHTATIIILYITAVTKKMKFLFLFSAAAVAICVLLQHVHYTIDVLAAPVAVYLSYIIVNRLNGKIDHCEKK